MTECLLHQGHIGTNGYGQRRCPIHHRVETAHRVAYELGYRAIPEGWEIHHTCHTRACVNVEHLVTMTGAEHRRAEAGPLCPQGHDDWGYRGNGWRICRVCRAEYARQRRHGPDPRGEGP